jgi:TonB family protein
MVPSLDGFVLLSANRPTIPPVDPSALAASGGPGIGAITGVDANNPATVDTRVGEVARQLREAARRARDAASNGAGQPQGGAPGPSPEAIAAGTSSPTLAVAPPPPPPPTPDGPIRVGGRIQAPTKIKDVKPAYPEEARAARLQGIVILEIVIAADGQVVDARVLRSIPGLDEAALDAVKQWRFTPTLLNGVPVAIVMSATINFTLN